MGEGTQFNIPAKSLMEDDLRPEYDLTKLVRVPPEKLHYKGRSMSGVYAIGPWRVTKAILVTGTGPDRVGLVTDMPPTTDLDDPIHDPTTFDFNCTKGTGKKYLETNLPSLPIEEINVDRPKQKLGKSR